MVTKEQAIDILEKFDFFQGQRAGRELWNDKPFDVQEQDINDFSRDVALLKEYIANAAPKSEVERLTKLLDDRCDRCIERERAKAAREIFEEIRKEYELDGMTYLDEILCGHLNKFIAELEKKYISREKL